MKKQKILIRKRFHQKKRDYKSTECASVNSRAVVPSCAKQTDQSWQRLALSPSIYKSLLQSLGQSSLHPATYKFGELASNNICLDP